MQKNCWGQRVLTDCCSPATEYTATCWWCGGAGIGVEYEDAYSITPLIQDPCPICRGCGRVDPPEPGNSLASQAAAIWHAGR